MKILFILYGGFESNSAIHVHHFANALIESGHECVVLAKQPEPAGNDLLISKPLYARAGLEDILSNRVGYDHQAGPDIIHAWTPREAVRHQLIQLQRKYDNAKLIIHLEDNEENILRNATALPATLIKHLPYFLLQKLFSDQFSHPIYYKKLLQSADGITIIMDTLAEFVPPQKPSMVLWPIINPDQYTVDRDEEEVKTKLGIQENDLAVVYTGNVHRSNAEEMRTLYRSVGLANQNNLSVKLIRTGKDYCRFLNPSDKWVRQYVIEKGFVNRNDLLSYMRAADLLLQPGKPGPFNDYRLPSKIPEFLMMGKPVALPNTNIGRFLKDGEEAIILKKGDEKEFCAVFNALITDKELSQKISAGGRQFALAHFSRDIIGANLEQFYQQILET